MNGNIDLAGGVKSSDSVMQTVTLAEDEETVRLHVSHAPSYRISLRRRNAVNCVVSKDDLVLRCSFLVFLQSPLVSTSIDRCPKGILCRRADWSAAQLSQQGALPRVYNGTPESSKKAAAKPFVNCNQPKAPNGNEGRTKPT